MIKLQVNLGKVDKELIYVGKTGTKYLNMFLRENRGGRDQYDNDGMIIQEVSKEQREAGVKGPIIGNYKDLGIGRAASQNVQQTTPEKKTFPLNMGQDEDIPF